MLTEVKGLVLSTVDLSESDRLITIYSEEKGIISALARGARSHKSRKISFYEIFLLYKDNKYDYSNNKQKCQ